MNRVFSNFIYQATYQLMKIIIPIISIPIVSKALGPEGIGIYNYTYSIVTYFILFSGLGITLYGSREVAYYRDNKSKLSKVFWEIFNLKAILVMLNMLFFLLLVRNSKYSLYFYLQTLSIVSVFFDVSWFYMGIEDFKKTMLSNIFSQLFVLLLILLFVHSRDDLSKYVFIQSLSFLLPQIYPLLRIKKYVYIEKTKILNIIFRMKQAVSFFIPQVAIIIYTTLNKTILGYYIGPKEVGYYSSSLTMNMVFITLITAFDTVMLPRMSNYFHKEGKDKIIITLQKTIDGQLFFSIPIMFGMLTIYDKFIPWFLGNEFKFTNNLIPIFSILIVIVPLGMAISRQYLIPVGKVRQYNISVVVGALISVVTNFVLLPKIGIYGSVYASILAETFVLITRLFSLKRSTTFSFNLGNIFKYILSAVVMCAITRSITQGLSANYITNILQAAIGSTIYILLTTVLKCNLILNLYRKRTV